MKYCVIILAVLSITFTTSAQDANSTDPDAWKNVRVTKDEKAVEGLTRVSELTASASGAYTLADKLRAQATNKMKKQAAEMDCDVVLLEHSEYEAEPVKRITLIGVGYKKE